MKKIILILILILLCGCEKKQCIKSHKEKGVCNRVQAIVVGGKPSTIIIPYSCEKEVCDEYEDK